MKVLVVDDSTTMRRIIINILKSIDVSEILEAYNGREAVEIASREELKLILMGWNMPVMSGIEALKAIRGQGNTVPVVMVTALADKERVIEAIRAGATNYIVKPFNTENMIERIKPYLVEKVAVSE